MRILSLPASIAGKNIDQGSLFNDEYQSATGPLDMGVLDDGTPFLTQRGLARLCGVQNAHIGTISRDWNDSLQKPRIDKIKDILKDRGISLARPHVEVAHKGRTLFCYGEDISTAVIEYYAFEAGQHIQPEAVTAFRLFSKVGLRKFVHEAIGYVSRETEDHWAPYRDRVSLVYNKTPTGYFSIFRECADVIIALGEGGVKIDHKNIPDISIGMLWGALWVKSNFDENFGQRIRYEHEYPEYFPQSKSNPQHPWCYPDKALPFFRQWLREMYIHGGGLKKYLKKKEGDDAVAISNEIESRVAGYLP